MSDIINLPAARSNNGTSAFKIVRSCDLELKPPKFVILPLLEEDSLSMSFGDPGSGKSFFAIDMLLSIGCGVPFHGLPIEKGPVVFVAGEGENAIIRRFDAWSKIHDRDHRDHPVFVSLQSASLSDSDQVTQVIDSIQSFYDEHGPPKLIVFDTLARNFGAGDENSTKDMNKFIFGLDRIRRCFRCAIHLIHHTGHRDKTRGRGSIALKGALDAEYRVQQDSVGVIRIQATKMKDAAIPKPMAFKLQSVRLPDIDGIQVQSAVLRPIAYKPPAKICKLSKLGENQKAGLKILANLISKQTNSDHVSMQAWRDACSDAGLDRRSFHAIKKSLTGKGRISTKNNVVFLTQ